jgi:hypothetical protein
MKSLRTVLRETYNREVKYYSEKRRKAEASLREAQEEVRLFCGAQQWIYIGESIDQDKHHGDPVALHGIGRLKMCHCSREKQSAISLPMRLTPRWRYPAVSARFEAAEAIHGLVPPCSRCLNGHSTREYVASVHHLV